MPKKIAVLIPARYNSKRIPKKPILKIGKDTLINKTFKNLLNCFNKKDIFVITDHKNIVKSLKPLTKNIIFSKKKFLNGTERCSYAIKYIRKNYDYFLIVSCDNPFLNKKLFSFIKKKIKYIDSKTEALTIHTNISEKKAENENIAKILINKFNDVVYISRSKLPFVFKKNNKVKFFSHHGLVVFKKKLLINYKNLYLGQEQFAEDNEWLKLIFNNIKFKSYFYKNIEPEINTKKDLKKYFPIIFKNIK
tara:strand:+ start:203 stop:949 length:747 start_codon:yes stop_codon:yes gene_type:complete